MFEKIKKSWEKIKKIKIFRKKVFLEDKKSKVLLGVRISQIVAILCILLALGIILKRNIEDRKFLDQQKTLAQEKEDVTRTSESISQDISTEMTSILQPPQMLDEYKTLYEQNSDIIGWLKIPDTQIDYPVMQKMEDEDYYLSYDFSGQKNINGSLILDTDSNAGVGVKTNDYANGNSPSTNLIVHGHTMRSGKMFGNLKFYKDASYEKEHSIVYFDSLYEKRKYQVIAAFYSQVFYQNQDVFKYYKFFQANNQTEFLDWYDNIKSMSLYDTGVTAEYGDEFITLSCCAYQVRDGRFVVVAKRIE